METVEQVSRCEGGGFAAPAFAPDTEGSTLQHVAPMKTTCCPGRRFTTETRCAPAQVSFTLWSIPPPVRLTHSQVFSQFRLTEPRHCQRHKTNSCTYDLANTVINEGHVAYSNCTIYVFPIYSGVIWMLAWLHSQRMSSLLKLPPRRNVMWFACFAVFFSSWFGINRTKKKMQ